MKFGYFDDANKEYVITSPKTPLPWINYLGSENFFSLISNTCGGYSFYKDAKLLRLTRYRYNNVPFDSNGHYYYIKEGDTIWNPGWMPAKTDLDAYECHHGMGYSTFRSSKNDLQAELTAFVPVGKNCEINQLTLTNNSKETKDFSVFSYVEFCLWNAMDDMTNFQRNFSTGEVEVHGSAIYHKTEYRERRNHYALYAVNAPVDGFDTDRDSFLGAYGENSAPEVVVSDQSKNSIASGWAPVGSHHLKVSLAPGESKTFVFILAYIENPVEEKWIGRAEDGKINRTRAEALMKEFDTKEKSEAALAELKKYWDELLSHFTVSSSEEKLDRMVNIWHQYQCMVTFNMSRSASYFESGIGRGMGFRDSCQDLLGFVHLIPDRARERILDIAATQFEDGSAYHQYQPLTKKGNSDIGSGFNDDPLWLIAGTAAYIKETGDYTILDEKTPYDSDPSKATDFMEHLRRSFHYTIDHLGPHKLPLIGRADWNDCLNLNCFSTEPGESFQTFGPSEGPNAESVFIAGMFVRYGKDYVEICRHRGLEDEAKLAENAIAEMEKTVLDAGWDGEWFLRAYDHYKNKIGSKECEEGQIYISEKLYKVSNMSQAVREGVGFITEAPYRSMILDNMSATENVSVPLHEKVRGFWFAKKYTRSVSDFLQNDELNKKKLKNIGNAELQKLAYEKWLVYQPKIVIIENPFTDMDINMREITRKMIGALQKRGIGVILLTANFAIMNKIKGESMFIKHGVLTREEEW